MKSKDEKQSFISKFIDTATLKKNKDGSFEIEKVNFRSSFIEQIDKLKEDYIGTLNKELDINYMDLGEYYFHDDKIDENYDTKTEMIFW